MKYAKKGYNRRIADDLYNWELDRELGNMPNLDSDADQAILDMNVDELYKMEVVMFENQILGGNYKNRKMIV